MNIVDRIERRINQDSLTPADKIYKFEEEYLPDFQVIKRENGNLELYKYIGPKNAEIINIPEEITIIGGYAFANCSAKIMIPEGVRTIKYGAFSDCPNLTTLPESVTEIDEYAFKDCINLGNVPGKVSIKRSSFEGCTSLTTISASAHEIRIPEYAFKNCINLTTLESEVEVIDKEAFFGCEKLTRLPASIKNIEDSAFEGCISLTEIPASVEVIRTRAFAGCTGLKEINITDKLSLIEKDAFENCSIEKINVPFTIKHLINGINNIPLDNIMVKNVPIKKFTGYVNFLDNQENWVEQVNIEPQQDNEILKQIIRSTNKDNLKNNFWDVINIESFQENLKLFREIGIPEQEIPKIFVNNYQLLGNDLNNILANYRYLDEQKIIKSEELQKLFFRIVDGNNANNLENKGIERQKEIIKNILGAYYQSQQRLPDLFSRLAAKPNSKNQLALRDALKYAQHMGIIDFSKEENSKKIKKIFLSTTFEIIIEEDEFEFQSDLRKNNKRHIQFNESYSKYFAGMKSPFYRKLTGINENWFDLLMDESSNLVNNNAFEQFFNSLTTIQRWSELDEKERATLLKNEIIGRLLYAGLTIQKTTGKGIDRIGENDFPQLLQLATGSTNAIFKDDNLIKNMLKIDPYSFDALRTDAHDLEYKYCVVAKENGYLFSADEITKYVSNISDKKDELEKNPEFKHFIEHINNEIGIPKIAKDDRNKYLEKTRGIVRDYLANKTSGRNNITDLLELMSLTDLYLRANSGYESLSAKGEIIEETAKTIFDKNSAIKAEDKLLYTMYNLNRLAHNVTDINVEVDFINQRLGNQIDVKKMKFATKALDELSRFGLDMKNIGMFISGGNNFETWIKDGTNDSFLEMFIKSGVAPEYVSKIDSSTIEDIRLNLKTLLELNKDGFITKDIEEKLETYANEMSLFFDTKAIIAQELLYSDIMALTATTNFIDMNAQAKKEFYKNNGYIIEVQKDNNNDPTLVCYSKTFREAFSIHLKNMPPQLETKINTYLNSPNYQPTIAYTRLAPAGVTLRTEKFNPNYSKNPIREITKGGFYKKTNEYSAAIYNFMEYDLHEKISTLKVNKEAVKNGQYTEELVEYFEELNVDEWFKDFAEIQDEKDDDGNLVKGGKKSKKYVGQEMSILDRIKSEPKNPSRDIHCLGGKEKDIKGIKYQLKKNQQKQLQPAVQKEPVKTEKVTQEPTVENQTKKRILKVVNPTKRKNYIAVNAETLNAYRSKKTEQQENVESETSSRKK